MPCLAQRNAQFSNASSSVYSFSCSAASVSANGIWSKHRDDITFDQLEKFWIELSPEARQRLLRIDKQTLFEQARKKLYCSRCNGLLLEALSQIVMYGKSLQQEGNAGHLPCSMMVAPKNQNDGGSNLMPLSCQDDIQDPSVHPWGGLAATRDGILTLLDCFLNAKSLKALQNVFDCARARERERELLYPDACGGGGRGWISQGMSGYGRGHGTRETCALHNARLSCDTLVDFWSALGDETRQSLMRMKEEDFIERLMYRFDSKRFCRDCRRNVIREFKELKELKRMRRETHCTSWFCVADTAFQYEVTEDTVQADWHQSFPDTVGTYHHFEWAVGTGEGKADILEFEDVGTSGSVRVNGLGLDGLSACFITLRAWKLDGRCTELSVKAHALKGQQCVHRRLMVGDGYVTITKGESIRRFFEHAEEAEEEEDDDSIDKDGNDLDGEGSRPQKHAKSPELAREFLLDAATVIFKEQVEKAFREGTARQNAHSIFVCLALRLLEERVHVACKEIITLEKQIKLLEEEDKEKREEEERKERKRTKEREKKLRRKERLKGKEKEREKVCIEPEQVPVHEIPTEELSPSVNEELRNSTSSGDSVGEKGDTIESKDLFPDVQDEQFSNECVTSEMENLKNDSLQHSYYIHDRDFNLRDDDVPFTIEQSKSSHRKLRFRRGFQLDKSFKWFDKRQPAVVNDYEVMVNGSEPRVCSNYTSTPSRCINGVNHQPNCNAPKSNLRNYGPKASEKFYCSNNRMRDRSDFHPCICSQHSDYRMKDGVHVSTIRSGQEVKAMNKSESAPVHRNNKYHNGGYIPDGCRTSKTRPITVNNSSSRELLRTKKVWEPLESRKKYLQSNSDSEVTLSSSAFKVENCDRSRCDVDENGSKPHIHLLRQSVERSLHEQQSESSGKISGSDCESHENNSSKESSNSSLGVSKGLKNEFGLGAKAPCYSKDTASMNCMPDPSMSRASSSDNCSSCLSEGDSSTASSSTRNMESLSTSDSDDASQQSEGRETSICVDNDFHKCLDVGVDKKHAIKGEESFQSMKTAVYPGGNSGGVNLPQEHPTKYVHNPNDRRIKVDAGPQQYHVLPPIHNQSMHFPVFPAPSTVGYYPQNPASWSVATANGLPSFRPPNPYVFTGPHGYGLSASQPSPFCIQYSSLQPVTTRLGISQIPAYQPVNRVNGADTKEQNKDSREGRTHEAVNLNDAAVVNRKPLPRQPTNAQAPSEASSGGDDTCNGNSEKLHPENTNFSLFHFGGPIEMATGNNLNSAPSMEGLIRDFSSNSLENPAQVDHTCTKKETTIEEYSLFASSNLTRFSFF